MRCRLPAVRDIAVRTLKKLGAIRERIDATFNALRDVEGASEREEARMSTVMDLLGDRAAGGRNFDRVSGG